MKTEHIVALYHQAMLDLEQTNVGHSFTDMRRLDPKGIGYVPSPVGPSSLKYEKRHPSK